MIDGANATRGEEELDRLYESSESVHLSLSLSVKGRDAQRPDKGIAASRVHLANILAGLQWRIDCDGERWQGEEAIGLVPCGKDEKRREGGECWPWRGLYRVRRRLLWSV